MKQEEFWGGLAKAAFAETEGERAWLRLTQPRPQYSARYRRQLQLLPDASAREKPAPFMRRTGAAGKKPDASAHEPPTPRRRLRPAVILALAALLALLLALAAVGENRWNALHVRSSAQDILISVTDPVHLPRGWDFVYLPTRLPEGYRESERVVLPALVSSTFAHTADADAPAIVLEQYREIGTLGLDSEGADIRDVEIGGSAGWLFEKGGMCTLCWHNDEAFFILSAALPADELCAIAESVQRYA